MSKVLYINKLLFKYTVTVYLFILYVGIFYKIFF